MDIESILFPKHLSFFITVEFLNLITYNTNILYSCKYYFNNYVIVECTL